MENLLSLLMVLGKNVELVMLITALQVHVLLGLQIVLPTKFLQ